MVKLFENKKLAKQYFKSRLPNEIVADIDWRTLKSSKVSWVDDKLKAVFSDINFTVRWKEKDIYLPLVVEHQSSRPTIPHLKMLRYLLNGYDYQIEQIEHAKKQGTMKKRKAPKLTVIIPLFLYNGYEDWEDRPFHESFDPMDEHLIDFIPNFKYLLDNLRTTSNEELLSQQKELGVLTSAFLLLRNYRDKNYLVTHSAEIFGLARNYSNGSYFNFYARIAISYLTSGARLEKEDVDEIVENIDEPVIKNPIMNAIEAYQLEGAEKAKKEFVVSLIDEFPELSNVRIAKVAKVSVAVVRGIKKEMQSEE